MCHQEIVKDKLEVLSLYIKAKEKEQAMKLIQQLETNMPNNPQLEQYKVKNG